MQSRRISSRVQKKTMTGLLLKYNKVHNDALRHLSCRLGKDIEIKWGDLSLFGASMDLLSYEQVDKYLHSLKSFDFVIMGDVFWKTGQHICRACKKLDIPVFFMQHGQWIYTANKQSLEYYPDHTLVFGDNVKDICSSWAYAKHSKIHTVGSPRYDEVSSNGCGSTYTYFSPPVIEEMVHGKSSGIIRTYFLKGLKKIAGIDKHISLIIQPHYRECRTDLLHKMFPKAQFADPDLDPLKLIRGSLQVLTSRNSTVVLDAIAHQKPVVLVDLPETDACFFKRGYFGNFAKESNNRKHLISNLEKSNTFSRNDYNIKAKPYIYLGNASERIAKLVKQEVYEVHQRGS